MLFSGYIFDVEGTLVDSVGQNLLSLQQSLADFGVIRAWTVTRPSSSWRRPDPDGGQRKKVMEAQGKLYEAKYLESVKAFTGVRDVFEVGFELHRTGYVRHPYALQDCCSSARLRLFLFLFRQDTKHLDPDLGFLGCASSRP